MKIAVNYPNTIDVDKYRYFGSKRFSWYDWTNTKRAANTTAKRIRGGGTVWQGLSRWLAGTPFTLTSRIEGGR